MDGCINCDKSQGICIECDPICGQIGKTCLCNDTSQYGYCNNCPPPQSDPCLGNEQKENCPCIDGYYDENPGEGYNCQQCPDNEYKPDCPCINGYYNANPAQGYDCKKCNNYCDKCKDRPDECDGCRYEVPNRNQDTCQCINGYFGLEQIKRCVRCPYQCKQCKNYQICTECSNANHRHLNLNDQCICKPGFYDDKQSQCLNCNYPCTECINYYECSQYDTELKLKEELINNNNSYFDYDILNFNQCQIQCKGCHLKSFLCLQCNDTIIVQDNRHNLVKHNCECLDGYYQLQDNLECLQCQYPCTKCTSSTHCIVNSCVNYKNRDQNCDCIQGYFDNGEICEKCNDQCKYCTYENKDNCFD